MTPAERLRAAADTIERRANDAREAMGDGAWHLELAAEGYGTRSAEGYLTADGMAEEVAEHVALWDPPTALLAATLMRETAETWELAGLVDWGDVAEGDQWRRLADHILGGAS